MIQEKLQERFLQGVHKEYSANQVEGVMSRRPTPQSVRASRERLAQRIAMVLLNEDPTVISNNTLRKMATPATLRRMCELLNLQAGYDPEYPLIRPFDVVRMDHEHVTLEQLSRAVKYPNELTGTELVQLHLIDCSVCSARLWHATSSAREAKKALVLDQVIST